MHPIYQLYYLVALALLLGLSHAFVPPSACAVVRSPTPHSFTSTSITPSQPKPQCISRSAPSSIRLQGLFGLGFGEIAVVLVALSFLLGPQTLGRLFRQATERGSALKDELQNVPTEFQKGMAEGESEARARKARVIKVVKDDTGPDDE